MLKIRPYHSRDAEAFRHLNLVWIEEYFTVEAEDLAQLDDPQTHILDKGGRILMAEQQGQAVGTVGLVPAHAPDMVELIKMSARPDLRGRGIGKALMQAALDEARALGACRIWLETNSCLEAAMSLYQRAGFRTLPADEMIPTPYERCNCQMLLDL